jgi:hypothetical protein
MNGSELPLLGERFQTQHVLGFILCLAKQLAASEMVTAPSAPVSGIFDEQISYQLVMSVW